MNPMCEGISSDCSFASVRSHGRARATSQDGRGGTSNRVRSSTNSVDISSISSSSFTLERGESRFSSRKESNLAAYDLRGRRKNTSGRISPMPPREEGPQEDLVELLQEVSFKQDAGSGTLPNSNSVDNAQMLQLTEFYSIDLNHLRPGSSPSLLSESLSSSPVDNRSPTTFDGLIELGVIARGRKGSCEPTSLAPTSPAPVSPSSISEVREIGSNEL